MTDRSHTLFWITSVTTMIWVILWGLNFAYPLIGHDYLYFLPRLLAGKWHFVRQGLHPFHYSPHLCGGLPMYGNPHDMYYSLPQFLILFLDPWIAIQLSIAAAMIVGYTGWYLFGRDVLLLAKPWTHLLALMITGNGSYFLHMIAGHLTFHTWPFLGLLLWLLFDQREDTGKTLVLRAIGFAFTSAYALYAGYPLVLLFAVLAWLFILPLDLLARHTAPWRRLRSILLRSVLCGGAAVLLTISKLIAVYSVMSLFPRHYPLDVLIGRGNSLLFIARAFWYIPQGRFLFTPSRALWLPHEYSTFLSPITLMGLLCGFPLLWKLRRNILRAWLRFSYVALLATLVVLLFVELTRGYGVIIYFLQHLPLIRSIHVGARFLYLFSLFVTAASILVLQWCFRVWNMQQWERPCVLAAAIVTIAALPIAYIPLLQSGELFRIVNYGAIRSDLARSHYLILPVSYVFATHWWWRTDIEHVLSGTTGIRCQESLFGYNNEYQVTALREGPVDKVENGFFNLNNPACFQYPEENGCKPGDRIAVADRGNFDGFRRGLKTTWKLSRAQIVSDWVSLASLMGYLGIVGVAGMRRYRFPMLR